ncbi:MAG: peptide deformylase [Rubrivivax sp.]|nr:peptide deformylase [Rubrivivax sp.]
MTAGDKILLLGDPRLRQVCEPVLDFNSLEFRKEARRLTDALEAFRKEHGFGRAISAPQIGIPRRFIAMNLGNGPFLLANPQLTRLSDRKFSMWDDCMSFPWLMVRLERHLSADLCYQNERAEVITWENVEQSISELLQHEIDHLNGVLAVDHALDRNSIIAREVYLERKRHLDSLVDYAITPTL